MEGRLGHDHAMRKKPILQKAPKGHFLFLAVMALAAGTAVSASAQIFLMLGNISMISGLLMTFSLS